MEAKHTPGPWGIIAMVPAAADNGKTCVVIGQAERPERGLMGLSDEYAVAIVAYAHDEAPRNARLIAAAPEMLAALVALNECMLATAESNASGNPQWEYVSARVNAARAAIAKAGGRL